MKKLYVACQLTLFTLIANTQIITDSTFIHNQIVTGIKNAQFIFEGKVVSQECYFNQSQDFIYTSNYIKVHQVWKGDEELQPSPNQIVEIITRGGQVGNSVLSISHNLSLGIGNEGMFLADINAYPKNIGSSVSPMFTYQFHDGLYFDYDYSNGYINTSFVSIDFECVDLLYHTIDTNYIIDCLGINQDSTLLTSSFNKQMNENNVKQNYNGGTHPYMLTHSFENVRNIRKNGKNYIAFDIFTFSDIDTNIYHDNVFIGLKYDTLSFGKNIVSNNGIKLYRGEIISDVSTYHNPGSYDAQKNVVWISANAFLNTTNNRYHITTTPKKLIGVQIEILDCNYQASIEAEDFASMKNNSTFGEFPSNISNWTYDSIRIINPIISHTNCNLNISGFAPLIVNGGVGDSVSINGSYFGNQRGQLQLKNADNGGKWYVTLDSSDITFWSDSVIRFIVPSVVSDSGKLKNLPPGTGPIKIINRNGDITTSDSHLDISFCHKANNHNSGIKFPHYLTGIDSIWDTSKTVLDLGYLFYLNPNIFNHSPSIGCVKQALKQWGCESEIRWSIANVPAVLNSLEDKKSLIKYGTTTNSNTLGQTLSRGLICNNTVELGINDIEIVISNNPIHNWYYDSTGLNSVPAGKYDFLSVILHELGHAHQLDHVNNPSDLMYFETLFNGSSSTSWLDRKTILSINNYDGAEYIMDRSVGRDWSTCVDFERIIPKVYRCTGSNVSAYKQLKNIRTNVYPNPFHKQIEVELNSVLNEDVNIKVFDLRGKLVCSKKYFQNDRINAFSVELGDLDGGIYFLEIQSSELGETFKIIKSND